MHTLGRVAQKKIGHIERDRKRKKKAICGDV
jgi:hypothetical protein